MSHCSKETYFSRSLKCIAAFLLFANEVEPLVVAAEEELFNARLNASALVGPELCGSKEGLLLEEDMVEMLALLEDIEVEPAELTLLAERAAAAAATAALFA